MKCTKYLMLLTFVIISFVTIAQTVHYTRTGAKYHSTGCQYLRRSDFTCSLSEALDRGLSACSRCDPPTQVVREKTKAPAKNPVKKQKKTAALYYPCKHQYRYL